VTALAAEDPAMRASRGLTNPEGPAGIVLNPRSFRVRSALLDRAMALQTRPGVILKEAADPGTISSVLDEMLPQRPRLLAIMGGDGTVQAAINHLAGLHAAASGYPAPDLPPLLLLAGGRTNLTARDLSRPSRLARGLELALTTPLQHLTVTERPCLRVYQAGHLDQYGFFLAGALADQIIRDCHRHQQSGPGLLRAGILGSPWRLLQLALLASIGRLPLTSPLARVDAGDLGQLEGPLRVLAATTLRHERGLLDPYARRGSGPLRATAVLASASGFWRRLPRLLTGHFAPQLIPDCGYLSGGCGQLSVTGLTGVTLDGQEFDIEPTLPLVLSPGPSFRFLVP